VHIPNLSNTVRSVKYIYLISIRGLQGVDISPVLALAIHLRIEIAVIENNSIRTSETDENMSGNSDKKKIILT